MDNTIPNKNIVVKPDSQILSFTTAKELTSWLTKHHAVSTGIWIRIFKKNSDVKSITYAEALDEALCYGWIDGQKSHTTQNHGFRNSLPEAQKVFGLKKIGSI